MIIPVLLQSRSQLIRHATTHTKEPGGVPPASPSVDAPATTAVAATPVALAAAAPAALTTAAVAVPPGVAAAPVGVTPVALPTAPVTFATPAAPVLVSAQLPVTPVLVTQPAASAQQDNKIANFLESFSASLGEDMFGEDPSGADPEGEGVAEGDLGDLGDPSDLEDAAAQAAMSFGAGGATDAELLANDLTPGLATNSIFFLFPLCENSLICLEGKSMTPHRRNTVLFRSS